MADMNRSENAGAGEPIRNIHGRRPGRGIRPYLIVLKILSVAAFFGGLVTLLGGVLLAPPPGDATAWRDQLALVHLVYVRVIIPGIVSALVFGTLLFASIWQAMIRMRWFVTKMVLIAVGVPALHVFLRSRMMALATLLAGTDPDLQRAAALRDQLTAGTVAAILFAVAAITLGRVKPRLGQDYGRTFARRSRSA